MSIPTHGLGRIQSTDAKARGDSALADITLSVDRANLLNIVRREARTAVSFATTQALRVFLGVMIVSTRARRTRAQPAMRERLRWLWWTLAQTARALWEAGRGRRC